MIRVRVSKSQSIEKAGGCMGCTDRLTTVKEIEIGYLNFSVTIRLCPKCQKELKQALTRSN